MNVPPIDPQPKSFTTTQLILALVGIGAIYLSLLAALGWISTL